MTIPVEFTFGPLATAQANGIVASITPTSGTPLTLTGALVNAAAVAVMDVARRILATYGNELAARTLIITGTNADGNPIQETLAIPSGGSGTVYTVQDFATVVSVLPGGGGWSAALTVGTNTIASSPWKFINIYFAPNEVSFFGEVVGTLNWGVEYTYMNPNSNMNTLGSQALGNYPVPPVPLNHATLVNLSATQDGVTNEPLRAWRYKINSGTGSLITRTIESGIIVQR